MRFNTFVLFILFSNIFCVEAHIALLDDIRQLSSEHMQGRKTGSEGAALARQYIVKRFTELKLHSINDNYLQPFSYGWPKKNGINVAGQLTGCRYPQRFVVVTAHYDHLGRQGRKIYHGADDNASGVAAMLALAEKLSSSCPAYSYVFLATDAEESGLYGSKAFIDNPLVALDAVVLNLNLDMMGRSDKRGRLYLTGARQFPGLQQQLEDIFRQLQFLSHRGPGHLRKDNPRYNWPSASDHGPFYRADIPYLFFGGQEHSDYHQPSDTADRIDIDFLKGALDAIWFTVQWLEQHSPDTLRPENAER